MGLYFFFEIRDKNRESPNFEIGFTGRIHGSMVYVDILHRVWGKIYISRNVKRSNFWEYHFSIFVVVFELGAKIMLRFMILRFAFLNILLFSIDFCLNLV